MSGFADGLTKYYLKDPVGNFIDLSYVLVKRTTTSGVPNIITNFKSGGIDIGRLFQPKNNVNLSGSYTYYSDSYYKYAEITNIGTTTITVTNGVGIKFYYLAVGGGGGSGLRNSLNGAGGGGGGGMLVGTFFLNSGLITVKVGAGGEASVFNTSSSKVGGNSTISIPNYTLITAGGGGGGGGISVGSASAGVATNGSGGGGGGAGNSGPKNGDGIGGTGGNSIPGLRGGGGGGMGGNGSDGNVLQGIGGPGKSPTDLGFCPNGTKYLNTLYSAGGQGSVPTTEGPPQDQNESIGGGGAGGDTTGNAGNNGIVIIAYELF
jgi:hypothetical protein